jgi:hypothetical protein
VDEEAIASVANTGCTSVGEPIGRLPASIDVSWAVGDPAARQGSRLLLVDVRID